MMHQSNPGVRRRRLSHPSIHLPRSVYLPSTNTGALAFSKFSLGAKKSSFATSTAPPNLSDARSIKSVKSISLHKKHKKHKRHKKDQVSTNLLIITTAPLICQDKLPNLEARRPEV